MQWLKQLFEEIGQGKFARSPVTIYIDNMGVLKLVEERNQSERTRHFNVQYHLSRDLVQEGVIAVEYVNSKDNIADLFTKSLPGTRTKELSEMLGISSH